MTIEPTKKAQITGQITKASLSGSSPLGPREVAVLASTSALDFMREKVNPLGMQNSPCDLPVFYNHNSNSPDALPIGRAYLRATASGVVGKIIFAPEGDDDFADRVCKACKSGVADAVSIGFLPVTTSRSKDGKVLTYETWICNELSVCGVGANPEARITQRALSTGNPDRDARMARAEAVRAKGDRMARATEHHIRGLEIQRELNRAEAAASPSHLDRRDAAGRRAYARSLAEKGQSALTRDTSTLPAAEREAVERAKHAADVFFRSPPGKSSRVIRAGMAAKKSREAGRG